MMEGSKNLMTNRIAILGVALLVFLGNLGHYGIGNHLVSMTDKRGVSIIENLRQQVSISQH